MKNLLLEELKKMRETDIESVSPDELVDIRDIKIDTDLPKEERIKDFLKKIGNPYCYKCGKVIVKVGFSAETEKTVEDRMREYIDSLG